MKFVIYSKSRPARGAWVEIAKEYYESKDSTSSRPARGAWVEMMSTYVLRLDYASRPARGAWVEIEVVFANVSARKVAPRKGRVG